MILFFKILIYIHLYFADAEHPVGADIRHDAVREDKPSAAKIELAGARIKCRSPRIERQDRAFAHVDRDRIAGEIAALVPDKTALVILYCRSGRRADTALQTLRAMGYERLQNLGGLEDAQERLGLPVAKE